jgi:hypothetical protein
MVTYICYFLSAHPPEKKKKPKTITTGEKGARFIVMVLT